MNEDIFNYTPYDIEDEIFLSEVPVSLLEKSLKTQFDNPWEYKKRDYIQSFITKYNFSKENMREDELTNLDILHDEFLSYVLKLFKVYLGIGFPDIDTKTEDDQHELIQLSYRFFINNIKKNIITFIYNFICNNIDKIVDILPRKKDVTTLNFKEEIPDENIIIILANLSDVVTYIFSQDVDVEDFLDLCEKNTTCLETEFIKEKYNNFEITGNFVSNYLNMITNYDKVDIESNIRRKLLNKYPKRQKIENDYKEE